LKLLMIRRTRPVGDRPGFGQIHLDVTSIEEISQKGHVSDVELTLLGFHEKLVLQVSLEDIRAPHVLVWTCLDGITSFT